MNQRDWGVFVCLVGGGQEIHTGEAGICEWMHAIESNPEFKNWHVYMSNELLGKEYNGQTHDRKTLDAYKSIFEQQGRLTVNQSLHLTACQRTNRCEKVAEFVHDLLECNSQKAKKLYGQFKSKYPIYLTRSVETAKEKLRERRKQLLDRTYGVDDEEIRIGMLMSSEAARLRPLGFEIKKVGDYGKKVPNWFLDPSDYIGASNFLEIALNEFFVQGLELDLAAIMWDADFRYNETHNKWDYYEFSTKTNRWTLKDSDSQAIQGIYMKNAYRVLLTRARAGMIIVVPEGDSIDSTRKADFYDGTYNYLKSIGLEIL